MKAALLRSAAVKGRRVLGVGWGPAVVQQRVGKTENRRRKMN